MKPPPKRGRGRPKGEPTKLVRAYRDDVPRLCRDGETQAEAIRRLLSASKLIAAYRRMIETHDALAELRICETQDIKALLSAPKPVWPLSTGRRTGPRPSTTPR